MDLKTWMADSATHLRTIQTLIQRMQAGETDTELRASFGALLNVNLGLLILVGDEPATEALARRIITHTATLVIVVSAWAAQAEADGDTVQLAELEPMLQSLTGHLATADVVLGPNVVEAAVRQLHAAR